MTAVCLAFTLLLAGCLGGGGPSGPDTSPGDEGAEENRTRDDPPGNASNASEPEDADDPGAGDPSAPVVMAFDGSVNGVTMGQVAPTPCSGPQDPCQHTFNFTLEENATAIVAEAAWNTSDSLRLSLHIPRKHCQSTNATGGAQVVHDCDDPPPYEGESPARIDVTDPQQLRYTGEWEADMRAQQSEEEVPFTLYISIFYDQRPPNDYSALAP